MLVAELWLTSRTAVYVVRTLHAVATRWVHGPLANAGAFWVALCTFHGHLSCACSSICHLYKCSAKHPCTAVAVSRRYDGWRNCGRTSSGSNAVLSTDYTTRVHDLRHAVTAVTSGQALAHAARSWVSRPGGSRWRRKHSRHLHALAHSCPMHAETSPLISEISSELMVDTHTSTHLACAAAHAKQGRRYSSLAIWHG